MAKRKNEWEKMAADRYFVWTIVLLVVSGVGLWTQITLANIAIDGDMPSGIGIHQHKSVHKK